MKAGSQVGTMGFPLGLPLKVTLNGTVREVFADYFQANLNSYSGNSGSPVFDINSGSVAGILVRGENDFEWNENDRCMQSKFCPMGECRGEDVFPASLINSILNTVLISPI
jgi:V8-like Glu-specific endopeptidase